MSPYYRTCTDCGSNLDPGEKCDCLGVKHAKGDEKTRKEHSAMKPYSAEDYIRRAQNENLEVTPSDIELFMSLAKAQNDAYERGFREGYTIGKAWCEQLEREKEGVSWYG